MPKLICVKGQIKKKVLISEDGSEFKLRNVLYSLYYKGFVQIQSNSDNSWSLKRTLKEDKSNCCETTTTQLGRV